MTSGSASFLVALAVCLLVQTPHADDFDNIVNYEKYKKGEQLRWTNCRRQSRPCVRLSP
jgi:hypothetical protein